MRRLVLLPVLLLAGCASALQRSDGVSAFAGDTQAAVVAAQAVNPWPKAAYDKTWSGDGRLALAAWRKLLAGQAAPGGAAGATASSSDAAE